MKNKVAIITGGSRGIGAAITKTLSLEGVNVVIDYIKDNKSAEFLKKHIIENGGKAEIFEADVRHEKEVVELINFAIEKFGKIDFLINNAGIVYDKDWKEKTEDEWLDTYKTNVLGQFFMIKHAEKYLRKSPQGRVVNISSTNATYSLSSFSMDYDASKAAVSNLTKNMSKILSPEVTVNAVLPGWVNTDMNKDLPQDFVDIETKKIGAQRFAEPEEIANVVKFLCSKDASYINGAEIVIDGGQI